MTATLIRERLPGRKPHCPGDYDPSNREVIDGAQLRWKCDCGYGKIEPVEPPKADGRPPAEASGIA